MLIITVTKWRRKLALLVICAVILLGLGAGLTWILGPGEQPATVPAEDLEDDVLTQPVKVQGTPGEISPNNERPVVNDPEVK